MKKALLTSILAGALVLTGCAVNKNAITKKHGLEEFEIVVMKRPTYTPSWVDNPNSFEQGKPDFGYCISISRPEEYEDEARIDAYADEKCKGFPVAYYTERLQTKEYGMNTLNYKVTVLKESPRVK